MERLARVMLNTIRHRGPDDGGFAIHPQGFVGNRRLCIIDVSSAGNQPFFNDTGAIWLVYNGEIYNYLELRQELEGQAVFRSGSDTEVLLRAYEKWGSACVDRLVGMFAFAAWQQDARRLTLCRDRLGKKPLYYHWNGSRLLFASEIKALLAAGVPARPDMDTFADYLREGVYDHNEFTFFEGIRQVGRGSILTIENGVLRESRYWNLAELILYRENSPASAMEAYLSLLNEAVRIRMRTDVPIAVMLSGGLDSSVLAVLAERNAPEGTLNVMTFRTDDPLYDEGPWAELAMTGKPWRWFSVLLDPLELEKILPSLLWHQEEPFGGVANFGDVLLARYARSRGIYVVLEGQGADETLAGYEYYFAHHLADLEDRDSKAAREAYSAYARLRQYDPDGDLRLLTTPVRQAMSGFSQDGTRATQPEVMLKDIEYPGRGVNNKTYFRSYLTTAMFRDLVQTKVPRVMRFKDKAHMMFGVELRAPFLDHRLVEIAFSIPPEAKLAHGYTKYCLRRAFQHYLPKEIIFSVKRSVQTPQREWLRTSLAPMVEEVINSESIARRGLVDAVRARAMYADYCDHPDENSFFLWQWVMLEWWHRLFIDGNRSMEPSYTVTTDNICRYAPARNACQRG